MFIKVGPSTQPRRVTMTKYSVLKDVDVGSLKTCMLPIQRHDVAYPKNTCEYHSEWLCDHWPKDFGMTRDQVTEESWGKEMTRWLDDLSMTMGSGVCMISKRHYNPKVGSPFFPFPSCGEAQRGTTIKWWFLCQDERHAWTSSNRWRGPHLVLVWHVHY